MADRKSLVYLDDVIQRALKDVLIPILGYRDTSKKLGEYTNMIDYLRKDVTALQIPDKSKLYVHNDMIQPVNIYIPNTPYGNNGTSEPAVVSIEFTNNNTNDFYAVTLGIPANTISGYSQNKPYVIACNKAAVEHLKNVTIKVLMDASKKPSSVIQIFFPTVNADQTSVFTRGVVTVYSENRNAEKVTSWDGVIDTTDSVQILSKYELTLGTIPYFTDVPNKDKLVYSNTIREMEGVTSAVYTYLDEAAKTVPTTLYHERQDDTSTVSGTLTFSDPGELQSKKSILLDVFGTDWSSVDIQFTDEVTDISGAFAGYTFTKTPRSIKGRNVSAANSLFKDSKVQHISDQVKLLSELPNLEFANSMFENAPLKDDIRQDLFVANNRLMTIHYCFRNTQITGTYEFWNMTHTYTPERPNDLTSLSPSPTEVTVRLEGVACYESVETLPEDVLNSVPENWKVDNKSYSYLTVDEFKTKRDNLISQYNGDLSQVTITIEEETPNIVGLFEASAIRKAPKSIVAANATSIDKLFNACYQLTDLYSSTVAKLTKATSAVMFTYGCSKLRTYPQDIFTPLNRIDNFQEAMAELTSVTGPMPTVNGKQLWELAGTDGHPLTITGYSCYKNSTFDNVSSAPAEWRGE